MAKYRLNKEAENDLAHLYEHGVLSFGQNQANRYYDGLIMRFHELTQNPRLWQAVDYIRQGYRRSVYGSHSIYYRIDPDEIVIVRVLGQQDIQKLKI